jgi:hypothetical protein
MACTRAYVGAARLLMLLCLAAGVAADSGDLGGLRPPWFRPPSVFSESWAGASSWDAAAGLLAAGNDEEGARRAMLQYESVELFT